MTSMYPGRAYHACIPCLNAPGTVRASTAETADVMRYFWMGPNIRLMQQPDYGHNLVHVLVRRPSVPKGDRNQDAEEDAGWEVHLRLVDIIVALGEADNGHVVRPCHKQDAGEKTDRNAKVGETTEVERPIVGFDIDGCDDGEYEI